MGRTFRAARWARGACTQLFANRPISVALLIFIVALAFRLVVAAPPLRTAGNLWKFDYNVALDAATGYGPVQEAPPALRFLSPATPPQSLSGLAKAFDPILYPNSPYPMTIRTGAYASLSALAMLITGTTSVQPLIHLQIVLDSLVAVLVFVILMTRTSPILAVAGALLVAFWYPQAVSSSAYTSTALVPFLITLTLWLYLCGARDPHWRWFAAAGLGSVAMGFLRAETMVLPVLLSGYLLTCLRRQWLSTARLAVLPIAIVVLGVMLWSARNGVKTGFYSFSCQAAWGLWEGVSYPSGIYPEYKELIYDDKVPELLTARGITTTTPGRRADGPRCLEINSRLNSLFVSEVVLASPLKLLAHTAWKINESLLSARNWQDALVYFGEPRRGARYAMIIARWFDFAVMVLPLFFLGRLDWRNWRHREMGMFLVPVVAMHLSLALTVLGPIRYSVPVSPAYPLMLIAAVSMGRSRTVPARNEEPVRDAPDADHGSTGGSPSPVSALLISCGAAAVAAMLALSFSWPSMPRQAPPLALDLMPGELSSTIRVNGGGITLGPRQSGTVDTDFAAGRAVSFDPAPYYPDITSADDQKQLTDGALAPGLFTAPWVGWGKQSPPVYVHVPLDQPHFIRLVRVHAMQERFPISRIALFERSGGQRTLIAEAQPPRSGTATDWIELQVSRLVLDPEIRLSPTEVNDTYIFVDEIQLLGSDAYEPAGEFVSAPLRMTHGSLTAPVIQAKVPSGAAVDLSYRVAGTEAWLTDGWNEAFAAQPIQFRIRLKASPGGETPVVSALSWAGQ